MKRNRICHKLEITLKQTRIIWLSDKLMLSVGVQHMWHNYALVIIFSELEVRLQHLQEQCGQRKLVFPFRSVLPGLLCCVLGPSQTRKVVLKLERSSGDLGR